MHENKEVQKLTVAECREVINKITSNKGYTQEDLNKFARCFLDKNGQPCYYSRLNKEDLNDFIELIQFDNKQNIKKEPIPSIVDFIGERKPTDEDFTDYYDKLIDLGYKQATITTVVTRLRKVYPDAPPYKDQILVHNKSTKNNSIRRLINNTVLISDMLSTFEQLAESDVIEHVYMYIAMASGRREREILDKNSFDLSRVKDGKILFNGQKKLKNREFAPYWIPIIGDIDILKAKLKELYNYMDKNPQLFRYTTDDTASRLFNSHVHGKFKRTVTKMLCRDHLNILKPHTLRALYAQYCNLVFNNKKLNDLTYFTRILGHDKDDTNTQNHYKLIQLIDDRAEEIQKPKETIRLLPYGFNAIKYASCLQEIKEDEAYNVFVEALRMWYVKPRENFTIPPELTQAYRKLSFTRRNFLKAIFTLPNIPQ